MVPHGTQGRLLQPQLHSVTSGGHPLWLPGGRIVNASVPVRLFIVYSYGAMSPFSKPLTSDEQGGSPPVPVSPAVHERLHSLLGSLTYASNQTIDPTSHKLPAAHSGVDSSHTAGLESPLKRLAPDDPPKHAAMFRPDSREDFVRRLSSFRASRWFGKPNVAGPVACARRGWCNVAADLLECEVISRLRYGWMHWFCRAELRFGI